jgi:hypothetical protein
MTQDCSGRSLSAPRDARGARAQSRNIAQGRSVGVIWGCSCGNAAVQFEYAFRLFLLPRYQREAAKLLNAEDQDEMERQIADDPERHPRIPGGGGMRKAR